MAHPKEARIAFSIWSQEGSRQYQVRDRSLRRLPGRSCRSGACPTSCMSVPHSVQRDILTRMALGFRLDGS